jgi:hypothetical protein
MSRRVALWPAVPILVVALLVPIGSTPGASAATTNVALNLSCQSSTPIGNISTSQTIGFSQTIADTVQTGSAFPVDFVFPADTVPSSQNGGAAHVTFIKDLSYKIPVPPNSRFTAGSLAGGFNYGSGTPTVTLQGAPTTGTILYSIPGPIPTDQQFQIPALHLDMVTNGAVGASIRFQLGGSSVSDPGFTTTAHVTSPFNGDAATACYEPAPKTFWNNTQIVDIDTTPPTITLNTPAEGAQYPQGAHVLASYACNDDALGSGIATCSGDVPNGSPIDTSTVGSFSFTVNGSDNNGNAATPVTHHYSIVPAGNDFVPPEISITTPPNGAVYVQNQVVNASYSCLDNESGIASCVGVVPNNSPITTSAVGPHTFTVSATDQQGNPHSVRTGYRVVPAPAQQNFTAGDVSNQIPVACNNQFQTAHKTVPVSANEAPSTAGAGTQFAWNVALGADFVPSLYNGTNLAYKFKKPTNGHYVSASLTGAGSQVNGATIVVNGDGTLQLNIASVTDQSTLGVGQDSFTPPPFTATIAVDGSAGASVTTQFAEFDVTATLTTVNVATVSTCPAGDPTFNGRANPTLTTTTVVDRTPPTIAITSPTQGQVLAPSAAAQFLYSCGDDQGTTNCVGDVPAGTTLDTSTSGAYQLSVTAHDAVNNAAKTWVTYTVDDPTVGVSGVSVVEGANATVDFGVTLSNPSSRVITINYATADGSAIAGDDYVPTAGALTFNPGDPLTKTISVPAVDDMSWRGTRTFALSLVTATHATISADTAIGTIVDDDPPPASITNPTITEGPGRSLDFAISLAGSPNSPITVDYATADGSAHAPARYTAQTGSLTFKPGGPLVQHVLVPVVNDAIYNETTTNNKQTMSLTTTEPANGSFAEGTGTIVDDEAIPPVLSIGSATIREGDTNSRAVKLAVTLNKTAATKITVNYATVVGSANTVDFTAKSGTLAFPAGVNSAAVSIPVKGDATPETDESFTVHLSSPVGALLGHVDGTATITDDDHPTSAAANVSVSDNSLYEGGGKPNTKLLFTVALSRKPTSKVTVQYAVHAGSADLGDLVMKTGTVTLSSTILAVAVSVPVYADTSVEGDESFTITLSNVTGPATIVKGTGTGTILNDD